MPEPIVMYKFGMMCFVAFFAVFCFAGIIVTVKQMVTYLKKGGD